MMIGLHLPRDFLKLRGKMQHGLPHTVKLPFSNFLFKDILLLKVDHTNAATPEYVSF